MEYRLVGLVPGCMMVLLGDGIVPQSSWELVLRALSLAQLLNRLSDINKEGAS